MRRVNLLVFMLTALVLAAGCSPVEHAKTETPKLIETITQLIPTDKSVKLSPAHNIEAQQSHLTRLNDPPPKEPPLISSLIGLDPLAVTTFLGPPQFQRHDNYTQIWQYRQNGCVLYLFLYPTLSGLSVSYLETRNHLDGSNNPQACFAHIFHATHKMPG